MSQTFKEYAIVEMNGSLYRLPYGSVAQSRGIIASSVATGELNTWTETQLGCAKPIEALEAFHSLLPDIVYKGRYSSSAGQTGADPEIFAYDATGALVPAWQFLPEPGPGVQSYWDGPQAEFAPEAGGCHEGLTDRLRQLMRSTHIKLQEKYPGAVLKPADVVKLPKELLAEGDEKYLKLGCSPSFNAYGIEPIEVGDFRSLKLRFAGAHFHHSLACAKDYKEQVSWFPEGTVVMMDKIAGLLLTALGRGLEDPKRRKYYGRPGEFRVPNASIFHLEYRTPSNFVLWAPGLYNFAADVTRFAYRMGLQADGRSYDLPDVKEIIMNCDADAAAKLITKHKSFFEKIFTQIYPDYKAYDGVVTNYIKETFECLRQGAASFAGTGTQSIADAWRLNESYYANWNNGHELGWRGFVKGMR